MRLKHATKMEIFLMLMYIGGDHIRLLEMRYFYLGTAQKALDLYLHDRQARF
jgi:hypothetical protein